MDSETANTLNYMIAGYAVIFGTIGIYLLSLWLRYRSLHQDEALLDELGKENRDV